MMAEEGTLTGSHSPLSDPSSLTTQALYREIANIKEQFRDQLHAAVEAIEVRLNAIDKATKVFEDNLYRVPTEVDKAISHLGALHTEKFVSIQHQIDAAEKLRNEKFAGIQVQFEERDVRAKEGREQGEISISAALQAAKEAVAKAEVSTDKRIDQIYALVSNITASFDSKVGDIKDRLTRIEGAALGKMETKAETHSNTGTVIGVIGVALAILAAVMSLFARGVIPR